MIEALISGKIFGTPRTATGKNGNAYATCKMKVPIGSGGETHFCSVIAFSESAVQALANLNDGDAINVAGAIKLGTYLATDSSVRRGVSTS